MNTPGENASADELQKFERFADEWWNPQGQFRTLHDLNPFRLDYISSRTQINNKRILDVGCGGGLLAEALAQQGARVTGVDLVESTLEIARAHMLESRLHIDYRMSSVEALTDTSAKDYDVVTCLELLEHVPEPASTISACAELMKPGGDVFFSTINRNLKSYLFAIIGAEYILKLLPKGTHDYGRLIRPSELVRAANAAALELCDLSGILYHPFSRNCELTDDVSVNYIAHFRKSP